MNHGRDDRDEQRPSNHSIIGTFGVAVAITAGLAVVVLATVSATSHDEYTEGLVIAVALSLAGLGFGLWGLATDRSDRRAAAAKAEQFDRELEREEWEAAQFDVLNAADAALAKGLRELRAELHVLVEQASEPTKLRAQVQELRAQVQELRAVVTQGSLAHVPAQRAGQADDDSAPIPNERYMRDIADAVELGKKLAASEDDGRE